jgi:hypothetical protein
MYKPTDVWNKADDILFLKYCPSKRMKCCHTKSHSTSKFSQTKRKKSCSQ